MTDVKILIICLKHPLQKSPLNREGHMNVQIMKCHELSQYTGVRREEGLGKPHVWQHSAGCELNLDWSSNQTGM